MKKIVQFFSAVFYYATCALFLVLNSKLITQLSRIRLFTKVLCFQLQTLF